MSTRHALKELGLVERWVAPRWKAWAAFGVSIALGSGALAVHDPTWRAVLATVVVPALTAAGVHLSPANVPAPVLGPVVAAADTDVANAVEDVATAVEDLVPDTNPRSAQ